jgi:hypothetical protein
MYYHRNFALSGLYPGVASIKSIVNLGHLEKFVVISGGFAPQYFGLPERYKVIVSVKVNGVWHEDSQFVDDNTARVTAKLHGIKDFINGGVMMSYNGVQVYEKITTVTMINNKSIQE